MADDAKSCHHAAMAKRPPARFDPPMPIAPIRNAVALASCGGGVYRATVALAVAFWSSGCRDLPTDDVTLATLSRLPLNALRLVKTETQAALAEICPLLAFAYMVAKQRHNRQLEHCREMTAKAVLSGHLAGSAKGTGRFQPAATTGIAPIHGQHKPAHKNPKADTHALRALAQRTPASGMLRDSGNL